MFDSDDPLRLITQSLGHRDSKDLSVGEERFASDVEGADTDAVRCLADPWHSAGTDGIQPSA